MDKMRIALKSDFIESSVVGLVLFYLFGVFVTCSQCVKMGWGEEKSF